MDRKNHNYEKLGSLAQERMKLGERLRSRGPSRLHFETFWEVATEISLVLVEMGQPKLARASMLLIFKSWCDWAHGDFYQAQVREYLRRGLEQKLAQLDQLPFMKLTADERLDLFYMMSPYDWALLKIS